MSECESFVIKRTMTSREERREKNRVLEERLIRFASAMIDIAEKLPKTPAGRYYADQLLRSGGSPALHFGEAQAAESAADFDHKMKVGLKELRETFVTLRIIRLRQWITNTELDPWLQENNELIAIFVSCIFRK